MAQQQRGFLYPQWGLIVISLTFCLISSHTWAFLPNAATSKKYYGELVARNDICTSSSRSSTELSMGIRDFLSRRRQGGKKFPDPDKEPIKRPPPPPRRENPNAVVPPKKQIPIAPAPTPVRQPPPPPPQSKPLRMGEDPATGLISAQPRVPGSSETASDRIQRFKSGQMTQEEKEAFMKTALSTGNTPESRLPLRTSPDRRAPNESASPFPKDSILRNMARGNQPPAPSDLESITANQKKQEYLDMVTNPNRFGSYRSGTIAPAKGSEEEIMMDDDDEDEEQESNNPSLPPDLGARLGAAAMAKERQMAENRRLAQEREQMMEEQRREFNKRVAQEQRLRQEEMARKEAEILEKRKQQEAEKARVEEERRKQEEERLREMQKAQDEYWAKKLAKEKESRFVSTEVSNTKVEEEDFRPKATSEPVKEVREEPTVEIPKPLLSTDQVSKSNTAPQKEEPSSELPYDFKSEQARKKELLDRQRDEQLAKLRALNSPLPNPVIPKGSPPPPAQSVTPQSFQPQFPAGPKPRTTTPPPQPVLKTVTTPPPKNEPVEKAVDRSLSISELTKGKKPASSKKINPDNPWSRLTGGNSNKPKEAQPVSSSKATPPPPPSRPIRMELPMDDDEEDDDDDFYVDKGMTIGEVMNKKQGGGNQETRAKQWGVDMSRFMDK